MAFGCDVVRGNLGELMEHRSSSMDAKPAYRQVSITTLGKIMEDNRPPKLSFPTPLRKIQTRGVSMPITEHVNDATSHQVKEEPTEGASLKPSKKHPTCGDSLEYVPTLNSCWDETT